MKKVCKIIGAVGLLIITLVLLIDFINSCVNHAIPDWTKLTLIPVPLFSFLGIFGSAVDE